MLQLWGAFGAFKHLGEEKQLWVKIPKQGKGLSQEVVAINLSYQGLPLIVLQLKNLRNQHKHHVDTQLKVYRHKKQEPGHVH